MTNCRCIARAYGDEPLERIALSVEGSATYVVNPSYESALATGAEIRVKVGMERLFKYDHPLFEGLRSAFDLGRTQELSELWNRAAPLKS